MNKIKFITVLVLILICAPVLSQNHYVVQWDRLKNDASYFKVEYQNGKRVESVTKKPFLKEGDILECKMINVNEFVFEPVITVNKKMLKTEQNSNFIGSALGGLGLLNFGNDFLGALAKVNSIVENQSNISIVSRGEAATSEQEQMLLNWEKTISADIKSINYEMSIIASVNNELKTLEKIIYAEDLDLISFKEEASKQIDKVKNINLEKSITSLEESIAEIQKIFKAAEESNIGSEINEELKSDSKKLLDLYEGLDLEQIGSQISTNKLNEMAEQIAQADFSYSNKVLVENWKATKGFSDVTVTVEETIFDIDFWVFKKENNNNSSSDDEYSEFGKSTSNSNSYQSLLSHRIIRVNTESPLKPKWTTGLVYHIPTAKWNQIERKGNYFGDTISFSNGDAIPGGTAISTHLMFEFGNFEKIIPNFSLGVSYKINEFLNEDNSWGQQTVSSNMSILLGGGIRSRGFRFFSLNAGISWSQIQVLNENLELGTSYYVYDLEDSGITSSDYFTDKWKPSIYVGVGFHF